MTDTENITQIMKPKIIDEGDYKYFVCPSCERVITLVWDFEIGCSTYPSHCDCGQPFEWQEKISEINKDIEFNIPFNTYRKTGYFTKKRGLKK